MTVEAFSQPAAATTRDHGYLLRILGGALLLFVVVQGGVNLLVPRVDLTWGSLIVTVALLILAFGIEALVFRRGLRESRQALGLGRPVVRSLLAAAVIAAAMLAFFPIYSIVTATPLSLKADWAWILIGAIAVNGLAEEVLFRGFVFGHLRQAGYTFRRAGAISLLIFGAVHLYLFATTPVMIAFIATLLAITAAFPFAFLFERGGMTIWAGVIVHVAAHAIRLADIPEAQVMGVTVVWLVVQFSVVFLVFAFRNNLLRNADRRRP